jgi:hypothetical protein
VLHNYLRNNEILEGNVDDDMEEIPGNQLLPCTHTNNMSASTAFVVRQNFTDYFNTVGSVPWQADSVSRGKYYTSINSNCKSYVSQVFFTSFAF